MVTWPSQTKHCLTARLSEEGVPPFWSHIKYMVKVWYSYVILGSDNTHHLSFGTQCGKKYWHSKFLSMKHLYKSEEKDARKEHCVVCALLGSYGAWSGNFVRKFRDNPSVPSSRTMYWSHIQGQLIGLIFKDNLLVSSLGTIYWSHLQGQFICLSSRTIYWSHIQGQFIGPIFKDYPWRLDRQVVLKRRRRITTLRCVRPKRAQI